MTPARVTYTSENPPQSPFDKGGGLRKCNNLSSPSKTGAGGDLQGNKPRITLSSHSQAFIALLLLVSFFFTASCSQEEMPVPVNLSKREDVYPEKETFTISYAYLPQFSHRVSFERHNPLVEYLKKETGLPLKQVFPDTFDEHMKMVGQGKIDISFSNPMAYVKIAHRYGAWAFAGIIEEHGKPSFRGHIICRSDNSSIRTLGDCKGKRWIAVDPTSAGGYLFGLCHFFDHGIMKEDFAEIAFSPGPGGKQEKVVLAVYAGRYDLGTVREGALTVVADKIDVSEIRIIASTAYYPGWVYASRKGLDPAWVEKIRDALLRLDPRNPDHQPILRAAHISGAIASADEDFEPVRELLRKVRIDLDA
jgi:phosphonate transport system substrate-binding protein